LTGEPRIAEPLALPSDDSFGLNEHQRTAPAAPDFRQSTPEQAVRSGQHRPPSRTLKSAKLESERRILDHNRLVTTAQQANESKQTQNHGRHAFDCSS
jgi:hypothetical protein